MGVACDYRRLHRLRDEVCTKLTIQVMPNPSSTSIKWVGMFVTALVGAYTIEDLWTKFGDLRLSWVRSAFQSDYPMLTEY